MARAQYIFTFIALTVLSVGALVYLLDRHPEHIYFIPDALTVSHGGLDIFGQLGNHLPTFVHVYALILLTVVVMGSGPYLTPAICMIWVIIDSLFEIGQQAQVAQWLSSYIPEWFQGIPFLEVTSNYFITGTYDVHDIISILLGAFMAYLTITFFDHRGSNDIS